MTSPRRRPAHRTAIKAAFPALLLLLSLTASAVTLGPRASQPSDREAAQPEGPPLRLAIPVLDAGIPATDEEQFDRRIWPGLRNAESVRIAVKLKEAIDHLGTFQDVVVAPDASVSADFYLLARIEASNAEDLRLDWRLMDATQRSWIPSSCSNPGKCWRRAKHRLWERWHERHDAADRDPFAPLYADIAQRVHQQIAKLLNRHRRTPAGKLSDIDQATATRSFVFASFFSPDLYGDAVLERHGRLVLVYLPSQDGDDWARIEAVRARDERFADLVSDQYLALAAEMQKTYSDWQKDNFPLAREARLARRESALSAVLGGIAAAGAVAAAVDGGSDSDTTATVLAGTSAVVIANSVSEGKKADSLHAQINEIGATVQGALRPMVIATEDRTVTLTGTARDQFEEWRELLKDLYDNTASDIEAVQVAYSDVSD